MTFLAVIPARGGSKGVPDKNIIKVGGKPLIQYTLDAAMRSHYLDRIFVSTDSVIIAETVKQLGIEVPFLRPNDLAGDTSKTIDTIIHVIDRLRQMGETYDYVVTLQPTQPLRRTKHIDEAIEKIVDLDEKALVSVSRVREHPILMRTIKPDGTLQRLLEINSTVRRQDFQTVYKVNGAIYINKIDDELTCDTSLNDNPIPYIMDLKYDLDIDTWDDLNRFEECVKNLDFY
jgi:CMP-N-acetylneuraminic acid synthetase